MLGATDKRVVCPRLWPRYHHGQRPSPKSWTTLRRRGRGGRRIVVGMRRIILAAAAAALTLGPAGCGGSGSGHAGSSGSPGATGAAMSSVQLAAAAQRYSSCMRQHGIADFPDIAVQDGHLQPPADLKQKLRSHGDAQSRAATHACQSILDALPPSARFGGNANRPLSASDLHKVQQFAACVRNHGVPHLPDPKPDGSFQGVEPMTPQLKAAGQACKNYLPASLQNRLAQAD